MKIMRYACALMAIIAGAFAIGCNRGTKDSKPSQSSTPSNNSALVIQQVDSPASTDNREPELSFTPDGRIILSWVEKVADKRYALRFTTRDKGGWSETRTVAEGGNWFINWADFPSDIALKDGSMAAHWLVTSGPKPYAYDVNISLSKDSGKTWSKPLTPHTDRTETEHGFVSLLPLADGRLGARDRRPTE